MSQSHDSLLRQAIELAQANKRAEARQIILKVVTEDEQNARAWMLLARITTDLDERRTALLNVVNLEPFNTKAQEALAELEGKMAISRAIGDTPEKREGGRKRRRNFLVLLLAFMAITILAVLALVLVRNEQNQVKIAEQTEFAAQRTGTFEGEVRIQNATATEVQREIFGITETYVAAPTSTSTPRPTLPPENTATPTATHTPTVTPIPSPQGLPGQIIGWGGRVNTVGETDYPIIFISVVDGSISQVSGANRGKNVAAANLSRIVYDRYFVDVFRSELSTLNPVTGLSNALSFEWEGTAYAIGQTTWPSFNVDGSLIAFSAMSALEGTQDIYIYNAMATGDKLRRLTNDGSDYSMPALSPNGTSVIAVRRGKAPNPVNVDLVQIDVATAAITPWTVDGDQTVEQTPRWSPDGKFIAYGVLNATTGKGDIYLRTVEGMVNVLPVTRTPDIDEIHPVFSPDSRYLAYSSDYLEGYNIFIYDLLTSGFYQLTYDDEAYYPGSWLP